VDIAFDALMKRYSRQDLVVLEYHLHIPYVDPMANPSTEARAKACEVSGTPSYAIDGKQDSGGSSRDETQSFYDKLNALIRERLEVPAGASLTLDANLAEGVVTVKAKVDDVKSDASELKLQIALVEDSLTYTGQNGVRFHPMVVRSMGGEGAEGWRIDKAKPTTIEFRFDLGKISSELKAHLEQVESKYNTTLYQNKYELAAGRLSVAAFVQDAKTKSVLQAAFVRVPGGGSGNGIHEEL